MQVVSTPDQVHPEARRVCLAIGFFDGVHLGHQQIIRQTISDAHQFEAASIVVSFDRHPATIVAPHRAPQLIYPRHRKQQVILSMGTRHLLELKFDEAFSRLDGRAFVEYLAGNLPPIASICVGGNFSFGHQRSGNVALLREMGSGLGFKVHGLSAVALDGATVSSTRIREAIRAGELDDASQMLGRAYSLCGTVVRGDQLGRQLGFPTANVDTAGLVLPPRGVYAIHAESAGATFRGVLNIGVRPTLSRPEPQLTVEAHLLDFNADLYGAHLEITFVARLRDEMKFASVNELKQQIQRDVDAARKIFAE